LTKNAASSDKAWKTFRSQAQQAHRRGLVKLFSDNPKRATQLSYRLSGLLIDLSKTHLTPELLSAGHALLKINGFRKKRAKLFKGEIINATESRPALHTAMRGSHVPNAVRDIIAGQDKAMAACVRSWRRDKTITTILHIGIGGALHGPQLICDALAKDMPSRFNCHFVGDVDSLASTLEKLDARSTRVIIASKSWTTWETKTGFKAALAWMKNQGIEDPLTRFCAITQRDDLARDDGIASKKVLKISQWIGGRYSLWSATGLPIALCFGWKAFMQLRTGASEMDQHFYETRFDRNIPVLMALSSATYVNGLDRQSRAVFCYDQRLRLLCTHLQQLETESLGKRVDHHGKTVPYATSPVTWGGVGTSAQHTVFQMLHQGTLWAPIDFLMIKKAAPGVAAHAHKGLIVNCLAQSAALMHGRKALKSTSPARAFPGNRPSTTIIIDKVAPDRLGALIALYEHRTFVLSALWNINAFDQMGVELGKEMTTSLLPALESGVDSGFDPSTTELIRYLRN